MMAQAHAQDFERKRRPAVGDDGDTAAERLGGADAGSSDEEDEFEVGGAEGEEVGGARDVLDAEAMVRRARGEGGEEGDV